jgi:hypothetical protein
MQGLGGAAEQFHERAVDCRRQAEALRGVLLESPAAMFPAAGAPIERAG